LIVNFLDVKKLLSLLLLTSQRRKEETIQIFKKYIQRTSQRDLRWSQQSM